MQVFEMCLSTFYTTDTQSFLPVIATDLQLIMISQKKQDIFLVLNFQVVSLTIYHPQLLCQLSVFFLWSQLVSQRQQSYKGKSLGPNVTCLFF
jgi:hypothetical protein